MDEKVQLLSQQQEIMKLERKKIEQFKEEISEMNEQCKSKDAKISSLESDLYATRQESEKAAASLAALVDKAKVN